MEGANRMSATIGNERKADIGFAGMALIAVVIAGIGFIADRLILRK